MIRNLSLYSKAIVIPLLPHQVNIPAWTAKSSDPPVRLVLPFLE
jgi:hypothetical protein